MSKFKDLLDRKTALQRKKEPWLPYYQQLAEVFLPNQADFTTVGMPGTQRGLGIYDGTPRLALRDLATTIDGLIKPKSASWFDVDIDDEDLREDDEVKRWLERVKERMWYHIYRKDARFIQRSGEVDLSLACFGWGTLWIQENQLRNGLMFRSFHNNAVAFDEDAEGNIDTISVSEKLTARQAMAHYERAGKDPSKVVADACRDLRANATRTFEFVQLVMPSKEFSRYYGDEIAADPRMPMQFTSAFIDVEGERIVNESGYHEFPAAIPRWETAPGDVYARSPGMIALPDAQTLQAMGKTLLVGGQRAVDPPIWVNHDSILSPIRTFPGGVTPLDVSDGGTPIGVLPTSLNLPIGRDMQNDYRRQVEAAFFKNVFNLPIEGKDMTATEIMARKEEFIRIIGPVFGRLETDYIGHVAERVFSIMNRAGAFPRPPDILLQAQMDDATGRQKRPPKVNFKFQSPIQKARKQMDIAGLSQSLQFLGPLAEVQPEILDNFDGNAIARDAPEWGGMPHKWMRSQKDVDKRRAANQQTMQQQQELAAAGPITEAMKNAAQAADISGVTQPAEATPRPF